MVVLGEGEAMGQLGCRDGLGPPRGWETFAVVVAATLFLAAGPLRADGPGVGWLTREQLQIAPQCWADVTVYWELGTVMDEPLVYGNVKYEKLRDDEGGCDNGPHIRRIWLKGATDAFNILAPLYVPLVPLWPEKAGEWGFDVMASPAWYEVVYGKQWDDEHTYHACRVDVAKYFFDFGTVTGFVLQEGWHDFIATSSETGPC